MNRPARAAAVVPRLIDGRVLVGRRTHEARSWPGTIAFPGGACESTDEQLPLLQVSSFEAPRALRACALRELGEEVGLWRFCRADGSAAGAAATVAVADLLEGRALGETLHDHALVLDDRHLVPLLAWRTWDGRFSVLQFLLDLPADPPSLSGVLVNELDGLQWVLPSSLRSLWASGEAFLIPPVRRVVVELSKHEGNREVILEALKSEPNTRERARFDLVEGVCTLPARTPTLPPATHTNAVLLGTGDALLVDPATPWPDEQDRFDRSLQAALGGSRLMAIVCTHHHHDHVGDVERIARAWGAPVWAHRETAARVPFPVDRLLEDGEVLVCPARRPGDPERRFRVVHTPGHAPGHVCLFEEEARVLVAGDMVAGIGSILIDPPDGHMGTYLASLERLIALAPRSILPSHGPLLVDGDQRLRAQLAHRRKRQASIVDALPDAAHAGITVDDIVRAVYGADTPERMLAFASRSVVAALELGVEEGTAITDGALWWRGASAP